jgi:hypothetical protein
VAKTPDELKVCAVCGATIYPEHIKKGVADVLAGRLLCPHCLQEKKMLARVDPGALWRDEAKDHATDEPILLAIEDEQAEEPDSSPTQIRAFADTSAGGTTLGAPIPEVGYHRDLLKDSPNATRCRTFHCKLNDQSFAHLNEMINEWVDANEEIQIKFATSCIGTIEAKSSQDLHLIVTVFY